MKPRVSIVLPAKNEAEALEGLLPELRSCQPTAEIIVVDDGSTDATRHVCEREGVRVISHPYSKGNGAAIKTGARVAQGSVLVFMDADGQHRPSEIERLLGKLDAGFDLVIGARGRSTQASRARGLANALYSRLATLLSVRRSPILPPAFVSLELPASASFFTCFRTVSRTRRHRRWPSSGQATAWVSCR